MNLLWEWCWRRFRRRYSWALFGALSFVALPILVAIAFVTVRLEGSGQYGNALALALLGSLAIVAVVVLPGVSSVWGDVEGWDPASPASKHRALEGTYAFTRGLRLRSVSAWLVIPGLVATGAGLVSGARVGRALEYGIIGIGIGGGSILIAIHSLFEAAVRPVRREIGGNVGSGDHLPLARPTFATWSNITLLATVWSFALSGAVFGEVAGAITERPATATLIATGLLLFAGIPITLTTSFSPSLQPLSDLADGTRRVAAGDFSERLPVLQDDDLGVLAASFNRMQAGLAERERLQSAFGSYVDPSLAERLLAQGDDLFSGERVDVTVMFADIRDFTPFAEANTAEDTVAHLNALFEIVGSSVNARGGHVNKFLGDGAMIVFGAPERMGDHADQAIGAAIDIQRRILERFDGSTRVGIGINTGTVIAGTIGGAGKLEFTLIGDAVNVAARVEQLTKTIGDSILITGATAAATGPESPILLDRGMHGLKGKSEPVALHAIDPHRPPPA